MGLIAGVFKLADYFISDAENKAVKELLVDWWYTLSGLNAAESANTAKNKIIQIFNIIYGKKHFSIRCLFASCVGSLVAILICIIILKLYYGSYPAFKLNDHIWYFVFFTILNLIIDYFSLMETRALFSMDGKFIYLSLADIFLTLSIFTTPIILISLAYNLYIFISPHHMHSDETIAILDLFWSVHSNVFRGGNDIFKIFLWSTFLTSFLLQVYILSSLLIKFLWRFKGRALIFLERLGGNDRVFTSIGVFISILSGILLAIIKLVNTEYK